MIRTTAAMGLLAVLCTVAGGGEPTTQPADATDVRALWRESISPVGAPTGETTDSLRQAIQEFRALESCGLHRPRPQGPKASTQAASPTHAPLTPSRVLAPTTQPTESAPALTAPLSPETVDRLAAVNGSPAGLRALADALYRKGETAGAGRLYEAALRGMLAGADREWALLQLGNCLRGGDPNAALAAYGQLLEESPRSRWGTVVRAQVDLLQWYQRNDPQQHIAQAAPVSPTAPAPTTQPVASEVQAGGAVTRTLSADGGQTVSGTGPDAPPAPLPAAPAGMILNGPAASDREGANG